MTLPPGYEYLEEFDKPWVAIACQDPSHSLTPWYRAFFAKIKGGWTPLPPMRISESTVWTPELLQAVDPDTGQPVVAGDFENRHNIKCSCGITVPIRSNESMRRFHLLLDKVAENPDVSFIPLRELAARLSGSGMR